MNPIRPPLPWLLLAGIANRLQRKKTPPTPRTGLSLGNAFDQLAPTAELAPALVINAR